MAPAVRSPSTCPGMRIEHAYLSGMKASALFAFIGITS